MDEENNYSMKLYTEDYDVIASGSIIVPENKKVFIKIRNLKFAFSFVVDISSNDKSARWETSIENQDKDDKYYHIKIINADEAGLMCPIDNFFQVARIDDRGLYISLGFSQIGENSHLLYYTWFLKKKGEIKHV